MRNTADVVIIGGGIVGASVAYHLAAAGCTNVVVVERAAQVGAGSTGQATGGARAQFATPINIRMSRYSIDFFARFEEATGHTAGYRPNGYLFLATSKQHLVYLKETGEQQWAEGLINVEHLSTAEIARLVPQLRVDDVLGGAFGPTDGLLSPVSALRGFLGRARESGVELWAGTEVTAIDVDGGSVAGVTTSRGRIATRAVVNAAGAWAAQVARLAGVELPVTPLRRQLVGVRASVEFAPDLPMVIDMATGFHFRPHTQENIATRDLLLAWPDPDETPDDDTTFEPAFIPKFLKVANKRVPCLAGAKVDPASCRAGLYEMTPDRHAIIGEAPGVGGFFLANGFSGHGVMHSPATGRAISDLILHGESRLIDISPLGLERFTTGRLLAETSVL
ncbi:MAG: FAD-binding oxidoreductase [Pyrinomonadaceae bacterium]|nr:FAD-binding oxidoreductase [Pyrinomonadaceae bacterium]